MAQQLRPSIRPGLRDYIVAYGETLKEPDLTQVVNRIVEDHRAFLGIASPSAAGTAAGTTAPNTSDLLSDDFSDF